MAIITSSIGPVDDADPRLRKVEGGHDNENETATWVEYYIGEEQIHRSVHVTLKKIPGAGGGVSGF